MLSSCSSVYQRYFNAVCLGSPNESFSYINGIIKDFGYSSEKNEDILHYKDLIIGAVYKRFNKTIGKDIGVALIYRGQKKHKIKVSFSVYARGLAEEKESIVDNEYESLFEIIESNLAKAILKITKKK